MIKILVDSASDCKIEDGIVDAIVPISVNIDGKEYRSGIDLTSDMFYELLQNAKEFPRTSQPSPQSFVEIFEQVKESGDQLIYFSISSCLSGTYQGALIAKEMVDCDNIYIIDTLGATHIISIMASFARDLINKGFTAGEIVDKCEELKSKIKVYAGVDTLEYLYKGGRLSRASAAVGEIAGIKPIVTVSDGRVESIGKCLGKIRAMNFILDKVKAHKINPDFPIYSLYTYGTENCEALEAKLKDSGYDIADRLQVGSTIGAHVGPGVYAVLFVEE
ncbi:MAG: DegV family protein [Clostridia bacterium]|nr:DegV family protein [Clostridia bacterium]